MSKIINSLTTNFMACALFVALTGCNKALDTPMPAPAKAPEAKVATPAHPTLKAPNGEDFIAGEEVATYFNNHTICYNPNKVGCTSTLNVQVRTATAIESRNYMLVAINEDAKIRIQNEFFTRKQQEAPNPAMLLQSQITQTIEANGLCQTAAQRTADVDTISSELIPDAKNIKVGRIPDDPEVAQSAIASIHKADTQAIGKVFCNHYIIDKETKVILEYSSIDGFLQNGAPQKVYGMNKTPTKYLSLKLD